MPTLRLIDSQYTMPTSSQQPQQANQQHTMTTMATMASAGASDESSTNTSLANTMAPLSLTQQRNNKSRAATTSIVGGASRRGMSVLDKHNNELMQMQNATIQNVPMTSNKRAMSNKENTLNVLMVRYQEQSLYIHYTCHLAIYLHTQFMI